MKIVRLILCSFLLLFSTSIFCKATPITEAIYGTISSADFDLNQFNIEVGSKIHLFDVTYDNQGTTAHNIWEAGGYKDVYDISDSAYSKYNFFSDATYNNSAIFQTIIDTMGSYDAFNYYSYNVAHEHVAQRTLYQAWADNFWFYFGKPDGPNSTANYNWIRIYKGPTYQNAYYSLNFDSLTSSAVSEVPEPSTIVLFSLGLLAIAGNYARKRSQA